MKKKMSTVFDRPYANTINGLLRILTLEITLANNKLVDDI